MTIYLLTYMMSLKTMLRKHLILYLILLAATRFAAAEAAATRFAATEDAATRSSEFQDRFPFLDTDSISESKVTLNQAQQDLPNMFL